MDTRTPPHNRPDARHSGSLASTGRKAQAARLAIATSALLVALKLGVGFATGAVSVMSEALHSATDLMASTIAYFSVRASDKPPDEDHPYGHGKVESFSGLAEALLILVAGAFIVFEAVRSLRQSDHPVPQTLPGLIVMGISAVAASLLSRHLKREADATDSLALHADAAHLKTDVLTSLTVFIGLVLTRITGKAWLDPVMALCVAVFIALTAFRLAREALQPLLDARLPVEEEHAIQEVLDGDTRVLSYHKLRTRKAGSQRHADVHVLLDDDYTLVQAHDLTEELEDKIRAALPAIHINIHTEPFRAEMQHQQEKHPDENPTHIRTETRL